MAIRRTTHLKKRSSLRVARIHRIQRLKNLRRNKTKLNERRRLHYFFLENESVLS